MKCCSAIILGLSSTHDSGMWKQITLGEHAQQMAQLRLDEAPPPSLLPSWRVRLNFNQEREGARRRWPWGLSCLCTPRSTPPCAAALSAPVRCGGAHIMSQRPECRGVLRPLARGVIKHLYRACLEHHLRLHATISDCTPCSRISFRQQAQ